jgi:serine/threonine-protein kinase
LASTPDKRAPFGGASDASVTVKSGEQTALSASVELIERLTAGTIIGGRYEIQRLIAVGGYAGVYEAKHMQTGQGVALKILASADERRFRRFLREAQVTAALKHPNTIRVFDFGEDLGLVYIAMELLKGETLANEARRRLNNGRVFSQDEAIAIGAAITRSLGEAHALGLVHRDLKPQNIFLQAVDGSAPVLKVLDFGIVKLTSTAQLLVGARTPFEVTMVGRVPGTPNYMSPEQASGGAVDPRSDLYSLGIILYQLVAGAPPFDHASSSDAILEGHVNAPVPDLRRRAKTRVSENFVRVVERALEKDRDRRIPYASTFRNALLACRQWPEASTSELMSEPEVTERAGAVPLRAPTPAVSLGTRTVEITQIRPTGPVSMVTAWAMPALQNSRSPRPILLVLALVALLAIIVFVMRVTRGDLLHDPVEATPAAGVPVDVDDTEP